jgi:hypothetical protein
MNGSAETRRDESRSAGLRSVVRVAADVRRDPGCPDDADLAAFADANLPPHRRAAVEAHLASPCGPCSWIVAALRGAESTPRAVAAPRRIAAGLAVAALLMLAASVALWPWLVPAPESRLVAAAHRLARTEPELFAGFAPFERTELRIADSRRSAAELVLQQPRGFVLSVRPVVRWRAADDIMDCVIDVVSSDGSPIGSVRLQGASRRSAWPFPWRLERGKTYVFTLRAEGALGPAADRQVVTVATDAAARRFERAFDSIALHVAPDLVPAIRAHFALREGFLWEAMEATQAWQTSMPNDADMRAMLDFVDSSLGGKGGIPR